MKLPEIVSFRPQSRTDPNIRYGGASAELSCLEVETDSSAYASNNPFVQNVSVCRIKRRTES